MTFALLLACTADLQDTATQDSAALSVFTDAELTSLSSWAESRSVTLALPDALGGEPRVVSGDRILVFLPLDEAALPDLSLELDLGPEASEAAAKAQDHNATRSNKTSSLRADGDGGSEDLLEVAELAFEDTGPCAGTYEDCVSEALPAVASLSGMEALSDFQVIFGATTDTKSAAGGPFKIAKRVDKSSPRLIWAPAGGDSPLSGDAMARLMVYEGDQLAGIGGPYVDWDKIKEILEELEHSTPPNGVGGTLVEGGMLLSLEWGDQPADADFWAQAAADWESLSADEAAWMADTEPKGAALGAEFKDLEVMGLGLSPSEDADNTEVTVSVALSHLGQDWPVAIGVDGDSEEVELSLGGVDCAVEDCVARQNRDMVVRKKPGRVKYANITLERGVAAGGSEGELVMTQGTETLTVRADGETTTFAVDGDGEACLLWIWQSADEAPWSTKVACGQEYTLNGGLPVGVELLDAEPGLYSALVF